MGGSTPGGEEASKGSGPEKSVWDMGRREGGREGGRGGRCRWYRFLFESSE